MFKTCGFKEVSRIVWQNGNKTTEKIVKGIPSYEKADKIGLQHNWGIAVLIEPNEGRWFDRIFNSFKDVRNAIREGIPFCCGLNFALDSLRDRQHVIYRWRNDIEYVPCWIHLRKFGGREPVPEGTF